MRESEETLDDEAWLRKKVDLQLGSRGLREVIRHHVSRNRHNGPPMLYRSYNMFWAHHGMRCDHIIARVSGDKIN